MQKQLPRFSVPGIFVATAFALALCAGAQTPPPSAAPPAVKSPPAAAMPGHQMESAAGTKHDGDMKAECQAMMGKKQEMDDRFQAMDATLDKLVAEMNAAKGSLEADAMEKPMAAVINELVAQRKTGRTMKMEMQPGMMAHMAHHSEMHGAMDCPMMKMGKAPAAKTEAPKPQK